MGFGDAFDVLGSALGGAQTTQPNHPLTDTPSGGAGRQPRPGGLPAASNQTASDDPLNTAGTLNARATTGENNSFLHNGPWNAVVIESFTAENPRQPPDTTGQNQRPVPWIVAYIPSDSCTPHSPHAMLDSPITNRRDGTLEEQRIHWQSIKHLFQIGHFTRRDGDPQGHLPQQNDRVNVTFHDARNPSMGGHYETVAHSGYQSPTAIPSVPDCEPAVLQTTTPSDASGNQAQRTSSTDRAPLNFAPPTGVQTGDRWAPHQGIIDASLALFEELGIRRQEYTSPRSPSGERVNANDVRNAYVGDARSPSYRRMIEAGRSPDEEDDESPLRGAMCADFFGLPFRRDKFVQFPGILELAEYLKNTAFQAFDPRMCNSYIRSVRCTFPGSHVGIHAVGRATDLFIRGGSYDDLGQRDQKLDRPNINGDMVANWLVLTAAATGVEFVIWRGSNFNIGRMLRSGSSSREDRSPDRSPHNDHIHIDISPDGAHERTEWFGTNRDRYAPDYDFLLPPSARVPV